MGLKICPKCGSVINGKCPNCSVRTAKINGCYIRESEGRPTECLQCANYKVCLLYCAIYDWEGWEIDGSSNESDRMSKARRM